MYVTTDAILKAINILRSTVHPFLGITFLACKQYRLAVGSEQSISIDTLTRKLMDDHHKIDRRSGHYFQPFRSPSWWVANKYPSSGLQTINTQTFGSVFMHPRAEARWGFQSDYVDVIANTLENKNFSSRIPADALAVWFLKDENVGDISNYEELVALFFDRFHITALERTRIFSERLMANVLPFSAAMSSDPLEMTSLLRALPEPPDAQADGGRTIMSLLLSHAGPADKMSMEFGQRLTIVTGDNGLGKSFLLDFSWWASTGLWAEKEALPPDQNIENPPEVAYTISESSGRVSTFSSHFDKDSFAWVRPKKAKTIDALAVFSRADGSFAVSDPVRNKFNRSAPRVGSLTSYEVWNGKPGVIEGLIRDWIRWQSASDSRIFDQFSSVMKRLSPEDLGTLSAGAPVRLPNDPREIPTVKHRYGTVPITYASSGVKRVLLLAYLIIWSWQEHELASLRLNQSPLRRMMVIVDEIEAHLHPKWQRIVLRALMSVGDILSSELALQMIAATHSPMILASMEAVFDSSTDALYHLYVDGPTVKLEEIPFIKYGDASAWLTSPLFGLRHARSREAESAIERAKGLQLEDEPSSQEIAIVSEKLKQYLAADDKFWPRWLYFAERNGVVI